MDQINKRNDPIMQEILSELPPMTGKEFNRVYSLLRYSEKYHRIQERSKLQERSLKAFKILAGGPFSLLSPETHPDMKQTRLLDYNHK